MCDVAVVWDSWFTEGNFVVVRHAPVTYGSVGQAPVQIVQAGSGSGINIYNGDIFNVLLVSPSQNPALTNSFPIQPLTNATVDGATALWAVAENGTCSPVTVGAASQMSPSPAQIATQINALGLMRDSTGHLINGTLGVPAQTGDIAVVNTTLGLPSQDPTLTSGAQLAQGVTKSLSIVNVGALLASGAVGNRPFSGFYTINRPSYSVQFSAVESIAGNSSPIVINVAWWDSVSGNQVAAETWCIVPGSPGNNHVVAGSGPTKGDLLSLTITNTDSQQISYTLTLIQTSHIYQTDHWESFELVGATGYTLPNNDLAAKIVCTTNPNVAAGGAGQVRLLPLYAGPVTLTAITPTSPFDIHIEQLDPNATASIFTYFTHLAGGAGITSTEVYMPRAQCVLRLINTASSGSTNCNVVIIGTDQ